MICPGPPDLGRTARQALGGLPDGTASIIENLIGKYALHKDFVQGVFSCV